MNQVLSELSPDILDALPLGVLLIDTEGNCKYANRSFSNSIGVASEMLEGLGWKSYLFEEDVSLSMGLGKGEVVKLRFVSDNMMVCLTFTPVEIRPDLYCCTVQLEEIKDDAYVARKMEAMQRQQQLMQDMLDSTDAILYSGDRNGRITSFNKAADNAVWLRKGKHIEVGDYWPDIVCGGTGLSLERMEMLLKYVLSGQKYRTIEDLNVIDGERKTYSVQASPVFDDVDKVVGAVLCAHDITELTQLQRDAAERTVKRAEELESWNRFYDMLLSVLAHDLRQPLSTMVLTADLVTKSNRPVADEEVKRLISNLRRVSYKSVELLKGLLQWVKSKKVDFNYTPSPLVLHELILEANGLFVDDQKNKDIFFHNGVAENCVLYGHQQMLLFICRNLISNATKHAPPKSEISVTAVQNGDKLMVTFKDYGKGMSEEQLANLFNIQREIEYLDGKGAGMALAISYDMMKQMNGYIWAESEINKGTSFHLVFPAEMI